ncbi:DinB family protein [Janibacter anophelis]|uniref:DinB family protein n=1 Tax=Janibacter anophelis TaxID=319054 RepID=UPI003F7D1297
MDATPPPAEHDTRDWTFVVDDGCADCGYTPHDPVLTNERLEATVPRWARALERPGATERPAPGVWSTVEYASHSRDLVRVLGERVTAMLAEEGAPFADYDGEAEAVRQQFWAADPRTVAREVAAETERTIAVLEGVRGEAWERTGLRGDGQPFTITQLCRYLLHDIEHHLHDVDG